MWPATAHGGQANTRNSKPAVLAFDGDVYDGLQAATLKTADLTWAQQHLVILSGLYGVLRPLDRLQPYRLEMEHGGGQPTWQGLVCLLGGHAGRAPEHAPLRRARAGGRQPGFGGVRPRGAAPALRARVVDCVFEEARPDGYRIVSFFAKRARGRMARYAVQQRVRHVRQLQGFAEDGYAFDRGASTPDRLVFRRAA